MQNIIRCKLWLFRQKQWSSFYDGENRINFVVRQSFLNGKFSSEKCHILLIQKNLFHASVRIIHKICVVIYRWRWVGLEHAWMSHDFTDVTPLTIAPEVFISF